MLSIFVLQKFSWEVFFKNKIESPNKNKSQECNFTILKVLKIMIV